MMQTFRKLPNTSPKMNSAHSKIRSNVFWRGPLLRLMKAQQISTQCHFASLIYDNGVRPVFRSFVLWGITVSGLIIWKFSTASDPN